MASKAKKLYFDIVDLSLISSDAGSSVVIRLTEETATQVSAVIGAVPVGVNGGDRFGAVLAEMPALDGRSPKEMQQRNEITALFVRHGGFVPTTPGDVTVMFLQGGGDANPNSNAPFYTYSSTGTTVVATKAGASAVFVQNPRVRLLGDAGSGSISGVLYVQRQHSIEV